MTSWRWALLGLGAVLVCTGALLPDRWFQPLPPRAGVPAAPFSGWLLLQLLLILQGVAVLSLGLRRWTSARLPDTSLLQMPAPEDAGAPRGASLWILAAMTILGLALRFIAIDSDLWLDEISPRLDYGHVPAWQIVMSYTNANHHLLNTLLGQWCVSWFGEHEWTVRLPAVVFGAATVPVVYWVARQMLARRASLSVALLVAVSYHHIFFSQNARGYTAYLFFALITSTLFVRGLQQDRPCVWLAYIGTMALALASLLTSAFVLAAHVVVGALALGAVRRKRGAVAPLFKRLIGVLIATGSVALLPYVAVLPQVYAVVRTNYVEPTSGFAPFSGEFLADVTRGLSAGFATGLLFGVLPFLAIAAAGYLALLKRHWPLIVALTAAPVLQGAFLLARGLVFSPRFFLLMLPLAMLVVVQGVETLASLGSRLAGGGAGRTRWLSPGLIGALALVSLASLPHYYATPKQPFRASLAYVESARQPNDIVIVIHYMRTGYRYYGAQLGLTKTGRYFSADSAAAFEQVLSEHPGSHPWLVTTLPRGLRLAAPDLFNRIQQGWTGAHTFPATIGDGDITVWRPKGS